VKIISKWNRFGLTFKKISKYSHVRVDVGKCWHRIRLQHNAKRSCHRTTPSIIWRPVKILHPSISTFFSIKERYTESLSRTNLTWNSDLRHINVSCFCMKHKQRFSPVASEKPSALLRNVMSSGGSWWNWPGGLRNFIFDCRPVAKI